MSQDLKVQFPPQTKIEKSTICGLWEVVSISNNNEKEDQSSVTRRIKYHFLEEMIYIRIEDGIPSHGTWKLIKKNENDMIRYSLILCGIIELHIVTIGFDELTISDGSAEYTMVRRL